MQALPAARIIAGTGIDGDRYAQGLGAYSRVAPVKIRHATFICRAAIADANAWLAQRGHAPFSAAETRRNFEVDGLDAELLNGLVGAVFRVGTLRFRGLELATPCHRPSRLLSRGAVFEAAFAGRGGLRAEACDDGVVSEGDLLQLG
ncbi:MAG: sulfurase [Burkholderiales bacterium]|nr:sulfurase [Burkholderiales bacterium]